ncbi:MAG: tetratricopeptide repeat protein [Ferruginibacter sp.]
MKRSLMIIVFISVISLMFTHCNNGENTKATVTTTSKITEIPVSTASKEAQEAFKEALQSLDMNDRKKARLLFTKAIEADPKFGLAYLFRANTSVTNKDYMDDIMMGKANVDSTSSWEKMLGDYMGTNLKGDRIAGMALAEKIASEYPDAARAQVQLGSAYDGSNQFDKGRAAYKKAIDLDSNYAGGYAALTGSYLFSDPKDLTKAEENAMKAVSLAPKSPGAQIALGDCYRAQNDLQKAQAAYSKAIELDPSSPEAYYKLGHANTFMAKYEDARKNYMDGGSHDETKSGAVTNTAYTYLYAGDPNRSISYIMEEAGKMDASGTSAKQVTDKLNYLNTAFAIAVHNNDANNLQKLVPMIKPLSEQLNKDLGNTTETRIFATADSLYMQSMIAMAMGKYDEAKAKLESMKTALGPIKDDRKLESYNYNMGLINMKEKKYTDAIGHFEKADPNPIYNKYMLAKANEAAGNKDKAMSFYKEVAAYNFNDVGNALIRNEVKMKVAIP